MTDQLELNFGDENSVLYALNKRELIERVCDLEKLVQSNMRNLVTQGEVNRVVMQMWDLIHKDGMLGAATQEQMYYSMKYAITKIREMET